MGCSNSKSEDQEAIKICKDRKHFIKQAIQHRTKFGSSHIAYIQSLSKVSKALNEYIAILPSSKMIEEDEQVSNSKVNYSRTSGSISVKVQEQLIESSETIKIETSSPRNRYETDVGSFFLMNLDMNSVNSQQNSENQWDFFWNPFSSLENFGFRYDLEDEINETRRVHEAEEISNLEECKNQNMKTFEDCNQIQESQNLEVSRGENVVKFATNDEKEEEFTVYMNRKPISMEEVIKDLEDQFTKICIAAKEVSGLLEANQDQNTSSNEFKAIKMLDLFRSSSSSIRGYDDFSNDSCMFSGSHRSTLDRLYVWEKKLYDEVKSAERFRIAYEKKCLVLRNQEVKGEDSLSVDKTRTAIGDLQTQITVSIHSIEFISEKIETLRDQELLPQLLELTQGLSQMWKVMAECHQTQKQTLDEAKLFLASIPFNGHKNIQQTSLLVETNSHRLARLASNLEAQLRNWRACFETWINSQRFYVFSLTGWLLRCLRCDPDPEKVELTSSPYLIYDVCIQWSRLFNGLNEKPMLDKIDFVAAGMGSIGLSQDRPRSWIENLELVGSDQVDEVINDEKLAEIGVKVLCHGMAVAVSSFSEFSISSANEYMKLVSRLEDDASGPRLEEIRPRPEENRPRPEKTVM